MTYYVFQVMNQTSYTAVVENDRDVFLEKLGDFVDFMEPGSHIKVGEIKARSVQDAIHKMERNEMEFEELNRPVCPC